VGRGGGGGGVKLRLCISGVAERAEIMVRNVERKFLRINHVTMENACKIIALISYEMFRRLYRPSVILVERKYRYAKGIFSEHRSELRVVL
jgi:hypothetical protein